MATIEELKTALAMGELVRRVEDMGAHDRIRRRAVR